MSFLWQEIHAMRSKRWTVKGAIGGAALPLLVGLVSFGCTADYVENSQPPVMLFINQINDGSALDSDVITCPGGTDCTVLEDEVSIDIANRPKNPNFTTTQVAMAIDVDRYEVRYFRSDGRNTEG